MSTNTPDSQKRFRDTSAAERAIAHWRAKPEDLLMLQRVSLNWMQEDALTKAEFRKKWIRRPRTDGVLHVSTYVVETTKGYLRPTFHTFCILVADSSKNCSKVMAICKKAFSHLRKLAHRSPQGQVEIDFDELVAQLGASKGVAERALTLLSDTVLGIHLNSTTDRGPWVSVQPSILEYRNIWEYMAWNIEMLNQPTTQCWAPALFGETSVEHYGQILAVVPDGQELYARCLDRLNKQPDAAITSARTLIESTLKWIAFDAGHDLEKFKSPAKLFDACLSAIGFDEEAEDSKTGIHDIVNGLNQALMGLAELRNKRSDSHGRKPNQPIATRRDARLAVSLSIGLATYLVEAREALK